MQAREYLYVIRGIKNRLEVVEKELEQARHDMYALQGIDYAKDKVDGGEMADLSDKVAQAEKIIAKIETRKRHLVEMREEARERISALPDFDMQSILIDYAINVQPLWKMQKEAHYSKSGFNKRFNKAILCFGKTYGDWLANLDIFQ